MMDNAGDTCKCLYVLMWHYVTPMGNMSKYMQVVDGYL